MSPLARPFPIARSPRRARALARALGACLLVLAALGATPAGASQRPWPNGAPWPPGTVFGSAPPPDTVADAPRPWTPGDAGWLLAPAPEDSVVLRLAPFSPESLWLEAGRLPGDARVFVLDTRMENSGTWVLVQPWAADAPRGWVHAKQLGDEPRWSSLDVPATAEVREWSGPDPEAPLPGLRFLPDLSGYGLAIGVGAGAVAGAGGRSLGHDYDAGGLVVELEALDFRRGAVVVAAGMGYRRFNGSPASEYAYSDRIVLPYRARSTLGYAMAEAGGRWTFPSGLRLGLLAGPVVGLVHEEADARLLSPESRLPMGETSSALDRLTAGGSVTAWLGKALVDPAEVGLRVRAMLLYWDGQRTLPLGLDQVDNGLWHADAALVVTFADP